MKLTLKNISTFLFFTGIFFIPFNSFQGIIQLGEFKRESGAYFFLLGFLLLLLEIFYKKKISLPFNNKLIKLMGFFIIWICISFIFNFPEVTISFYKKTTGIYRFLRQFFALLLSCVFFFLFYWNVIKQMSNREVLFKIRKVFLYSFIAVSIYGFFEILYLVFGISSAHYILNIFDYFPFTEFDVDINNRISSVTFEPPALATFLITVAGWMFSYILTSKSIFRFIPTLSVLILVYYSGSRTALIVVFIQLIIFLSLILTREQKKLSILYTTISIFFVSFFVLITNSDKIVNDAQKKMESLDFIGNLKSNVSNQSRFGIQYANLIVFSKNPIAGVGFGQQGFHAINHYPIWAKKNNYEFKEIYLNKNNPNFPPGYNLYIRLLAETGIIGFLIFIAILYVVIKESKNAIKNGQNEIKILGIISLISFAGYGLNFLQLDTFRIYGFWILCAIILKIGFNINRESK